jgi:hypothetical protein
MGTYSHFAHCLRGSLCLVFLLAHGLSSAQNFVDKARPTISRATDFVVVPTALKVNSDLKLLKLNTPQAMKVTGSNLQARIFSLFDDEKQPSPGTTIDDCNIYVTTIYPIRPSTTGELKIAKVDPAWLDLSNTEKSVFDGHFYIVLETAGPDDRIFRLNRKDADRYFAQGFRVTVQADKNISLESVIRMHEGRKADGVTLNRQINGDGNKVPCYRYTSHTTAFARLEQEIIQGELLACR